MHSNVKSWPKFTIVQVLQHHSTCTELAGQSLRTSEPINSVTVIIHRIAPFQSVVSLLANHESQRRQTAALSCCEVQVFQLLCFMLQKDIPYIHIVKRLYVCTSVLFWLLAHNFKVNVLVVYIYSFFCISLCLENKREIVRERQRETESNITDWQSDSQETNHCYKHNKIVLPFATPLLSYKGS